MKMHVTFDRAGAYIVNYFCLGWMFLKHSASLMTICSLSSDSVNELKEVNYWVHSQTLSTVY